MNPLLLNIPPGQVWIEVMDLPSALLALDLLVEHSMQCDKERHPCDSDTI